MTVIRDSAGVNMTIGATSAGVNGQNVTIDQPTIIIGGRVLVPLRFEAEAFGVAVYWDASDRIVTVTS